jgi:hypothetical protein
VAEQGQTAKVTVRMGRFTADATVQATPAGLLAVGGLVSCILLSTAVLVWTATSVRRQHPIASRLGR